MNTRKILASLVLGSAMLTGCEEGVDRNQPGDDDYTSPGRQTPAQPSPSGTTGDESTTGGQSGSAQIQTRAQSLIAEVNQHIRNRDFDQAQQKLDELESLRSQLPQAMQTQIASLRTSLNAARSGSGGAGSGTTPPSSPSTPPTTPPTTPPEPEVEEEPMTPRSNP